MYDILPRDRPADRSDLVGCGEQKRRGRESFAADRLDEAIEDSLGRAPGQLLEDDRAHQ